MAEVHATPAPSGLAGTAGAFTRERWNQDGPVLRIQSACKVFGKKDALVRALDDLSLTVHPGEFIGIMGPSGSGKTTLLNCISTIDRTTSGAIYVGGRDITRLPARELSRYRRDELGFIFQDANLLDTLTGYENIALGLTIQGQPVSLIQSRIEYVTKLLAIADVLDRFPYEMSGGQRQRVAAARAIVTRPKLILADEPTGALDSANAAALLETLAMMNERLSATILMVTHDAYAASFTQRVLFIKDGKVFNELRRGDESREDFFSAIMDVVSFLGGVVNDVR